MAISNQTKAVFEWCGLGYIRLQAGIGVNSILYPYKEASTFRHGNIFIINRELFVSDLIMELYGN